MAKPPVAQTGGAVVPGRHFQVPEIVLQISDAAFLDDDLGARLHQFGLQVPDLFALLLQKFVDAMHDVPPFRLSAIQSMNIFTAMLLTATV